VIDAAALVALMLGQVIMGAALAVLAHLGLASVYTGSARTRHAVAATSFYAAALWPLACVLPQHLTVTYGQDAYPLLDAHAFMLPALGEGAWINTACVAVLSTAAIITLVRLALTLAAAAKGELLAARATRTAPERVGLPANTRVGVSASVQGPVLMGLLHPTILFPPRLQDTPELPALLRHELAHLIRRDLSAAFRQRLIEDVCWWNWPLLRLGRWLAEQREMASDEWAAGPDGKYARALLHETRTRAAPAAGGVALGGSGIERRLERLAEPRRRPLALIVALMALSIFAGAVGAPRLDRSGVTHIGIDSY
jgi:hypothetical protein